MRCLNLLVVFVLIGLLALTGYNYWQINQLKSEIASLKERVAQNEQQSWDRELLAALGIVKTHTRQARELLSKGQMESARVEIEKSLRKLEKATALSQDVAEDAARGLGSAWQAIHDEVQRAVDEFSKQNAGRRPGGNESASGE